MPTTSSSNQPQLFHCPTCGASLPVPETPSVRCEYCGSNVLVPPEYRPRQQAAPAPPAPAAPQQVIISIPAQADYEAQASVRRPVIAWVLGLVFLCVLVSSILMVTGVVSSTALFGQSLNLVFTEVSRSQDPRQPTTQPGVTAATIAPTATAVPPLTIELQFGSKGTGPGQFDDARYAIPDLDGNIFVGEYSGGRIQKFDPGGKFLQLINLQPDRNGNTYLVDMVADFQNRLYAVRGGDILVYNAVDGALLNTIPGVFPELYYQSLAIDLSNNLYATHQTAGELDLIKMTGDGQFIWHQQQVLEDIAPKNRPNAADWIAADGPGNVYLMDRNAGVIYKFDTNGQFVDRFGSKGQAANEFNSPGQMAVDNTGLIYVIDNFNGIVIKVFDGNGIFKGLYPYPNQLGYPRKLAFDLANNLYTVTINAEVVRIKLNPDLIVKP